MPKSSVDYATDNITVYRFCPYQCRYCWAWRLGIFRSRIVRGKYDPLREATKYLYKYNRIIVVSFTSDPYPPQEAEKQLTRKVLSILSKSRNRVLVLTKNPILALRDIDIMLQGDVWLGTTITTIDDKVASDWEPRAPPPSQRLNALLYAKKRGIRTWLSVEPIIPGTTYPEEIIRETLWYVDFYVLGSLNYVKQLRLQFREEDLREWYDKHVKPAIKLLKTLNKRYHIKKELRRYLGEVGESN